MHVQVIFWLYLVLKFFISVFIYIIMTIYCSLQNHSMYYDHFLFCLTFCFLLWVNIVVGQLSHVQLFVTPWMAAHQASLSFTISQSLLKLISIELVMPSSVIRFSSCPQSFPASGSFPMSQLFASSGQSTGASALASVLPMNIQGWFPLGSTGLISLCPRDSQESSPTPQAKSINSLALSLLCGPTLTSIHDYWKNHSFDYSDLLSTKWCLCFLIHCLGLL